ncbi:LacI family DNA-binding transcriptional regulator [Agromyces sp. MMS24-JH15]|uniref:LacI family DNA-binding transcriptional regulator n=1 Tax=Agromyces sp. MMS24-JH15 TaxID=3243765 RepID=UPI00374A6A1A
MKGSRRRPTLREVAELAGVSQATASKVLNGRSDVAPQTRERVLEVMESEGYHRTGNRSTVDGEPPIVAVFDDLASTYVSLTLEGVVLAAAEHDVDVVVRINPTAFHDLSDRAARAWIDANRGARGIISVTSMVPRSLIESAERRRIPLVSIDPVDSFDERIVSISSTDWAGGRSVTEHLLALGHRDIAWIGGPSGSAPTIERFQGYRAAHELAGVPTSAQLHRNGRYTFESGVLLGGELLDSGVRCTAVVCGSDSIAFGVMEAARRRGIRLPEDLSITGFDDVPQAEWVAPKLTSVRAPLIGIGRMAVETVLALAEGRAPISHNIQLSTSLVVRESTAPPPTAVDAG